MNTVAACVKGRVEKEEAGVALARRLTLSLNRNIPSQFLPLSALVGLGRFTKPALLPHLFYLLGKVFHVEREEWFLSPAALHGYAA